MISIRNTQKTVALSTTQIKRTVEKMLSAAGYKGFDIGLWLTTNKTIRNYNKTFRKKDKPTDILSFPYHESLKPGEKIKVYADEDKNLGDLIVSVEFVLKDAPTRWERSFDDHMDALLAHGIAHLLNYDHQTDAEFAQMQKIERKLLKSIDKEHLLKIYNLHD